MKICYVGSNSPRLANLMRDMRDRGHEIHWIALDIPKYLLRDVSIHNQISLYSKSFVYRNFLAVFYFILFYFKVRKITPHVIHAINIKWSGWFSVLTRLKNVIVTTQGGDVMASQNVATDLFHKWLRRHTILNAAVVTYGNNTMLKDINRWASPKRSFKYFAGVNLQLYNFKKSFLAVKEKHDILHRKVVFSPRMFEQNSNLDTVINSIPIVKRIFPNVLYVFVTHQEIDNYSIMMKNLINNLNVADNVLFLNEVPPNEMPAYYSISDVVISILTSDGMPATLVEAMAMKVPLIISKNSSYQEIMKKPYALMVDHRNKKEVADAIVKLISNYDGLEKMKETAYAWVLKYANSKKLNDDLEKLYFELVDKNV